ncbi:hypothetical protein Btru_069611 [Bulinus truncatus]|nr:hypothetical protein Btru_069611 [Bulinus truncatus]
MRNKHHTVPATHEIIRRHLDISLTRGPTLNLSVGPKEDLASLIVYVFIQLNGYDRETHRAISVGCNQRLTGPSKWVAIRDSQGHLNGLQSETHRAISMGCNQRLTGPHQWAAIRDSQGHLNGLQSETHRAISMGCNQRLTEPSQWVAIGDSQGHLNGLQSETHRTTSMGCNQRLTGSPQWVAIRDSQGHLNGLQSETHRATSMGCNQRLTGPPQWVAIRDSQGHLNGLQSETHRAISMSCNRRLTEPSQWVAIGAVERHVQETVSAVQLVVLPPMLYNGVQLKTQTEQEEVGLKKKQNNIHRKMSVPKLVDEKIAHHILETTDTFLFDCDGVLWTTNGPIDGSPEVIAKLKGMGKKVYLITNNSDRSRKEYWELCQQIGIHVEPDDIMCTAYAAAMYLKSIGFKDTVYLIGKESSMGVELRHAGIRYFGPGPDPLQGSLKDWLKMELDPEVKCVLIATDYDISYMKILKASSYLCDPSCMYIATNEDRRLPAKEKHICIPDTACMVVPVSLASNRNPLVMGKPERQMFDLIVKAHNLDPSKIFMTGDSLNTDIQMAKTCGIRSMIVLTGITTEDELITANGQGRNAVPEKQPDFYAPKLSDFGKYF